MADTSEPDLDLPEAPHCLALLKQSAPDFYLADLLLNPRYSVEIVVLHAFHVEITNITLSGADHMAAQVRLQWWLEVVQGQRDEEAQGHPVARALLAVIGHHNLPVASFVAKLEAHIFDLYQDPMGDRGVFEAYCGETRSCLFQWAALVSGAEPSRGLADASGHAGVASGAVQVLENMARSQAMGQVFVPSDLLAAAGLSPAEFLTEATQKHEAVIVGLCDLATEHHQKASTALGHLPTQTRGVFKPLALLPLYIDRALRAPRDVFAPRPPLSQLRKQWALWRF